MDRLKRRGQASVDRPEQIGEKDIKLIEKEIGPRNIVRMPG